MVWRMLGDANVSSKSTCINFAEQHHLCFHSTLPRILYKLTTIVHYNKKKHYQASKPVWFP